MARQKLLHCCNADAVFALCIPVRGGGHSPNRSLANKHPHVDGYWPTPTRLPHECESASPNLCKYQKSRRDYGGGHGTCRKVMCSECRVRNAQLLCRRGECQSLAPRQDQIASAILQTSKC